ncbi:MAG: imidazole glycerol phosphate synthase subunit HisH, partial [Blastochloris sp.]|nr:imidazole glycerol phosphate synthase subunit HisH [Blastochloris sp.]
KALLHLGAKVSVATQGAELKTADRIILPGVGAFADGMEGLRRAGHDQALREAVDAGKPLLGICLGAQMLLGGSEEFGTYAGLGIIEGQVVRIPESGIKVPHVGWKCLERPEGISWEGTPLALTAEGTWAYFVHSYHMKPTESDQVLAVVRSGDHLITAAIRRGAVTGFQFHPEKSGQAGLDMLRAFLV